MSNTTEAVLSFNGTSYYLRCEVIEHGFSRLATQAGLPATEGTEGPVITIDLGVVIQQIVLTGLVNSTSENATDPSKANLEEAFKTWWAYGDEATDLPTCQIPGGTYHVNLKLATFRMEGGTEQYWTFSITLLVRDKSV